MLNIHSRHHYAPHRKRIPRITATGECRVTTMINDLLIAILFVSGSLFNFTDMPAVYGNTLYLFGSLILAGRALYNVKIHLSIEQPEESQRYWK
ncbi:YrhK family protein [Indiicoccus explosivorum]|uniref:YrhK family protein n=1 Tax=Indiicoccus explosivorum TaxID=1917864 RepID=UPI000B441C42|nr:YrhK family protein [Indiicoccus explosivorum]